MNNKTAGASWASAFGDAKKQMAEPAEGSKADKAEDKAEGQIDVTCPKCGAEFDVDAKTGAVVSG